MITRNPRRFFVLLMAVLIFLLPVLACSGELPIGADPTPTQAPTSTRPLPTPDNSGRQTAQVLNVIDGDTIEVSLAGANRNVRYIGINTPEHDQPYFEEAVEVNRRLVEGKNVQLEDDLETFDQYGRRLAYVWVDGVMANLEIIRLGYANAFTVPPNVRYEEQFRQAEQEAREAGRGLWAGSDVALKIMHIQADAPGSDNENPNGEWIEIANQGSQPVQMLGFTLKDEANHIYTFGKFNIAPGASFRLYSGQGQDNAGELYWGFSGESVWNNDSDAAFLRDAQGALVDSFEY